MAAFIRQVVNEARQNRPSIKVHPCDSEADIEIADIYSGLIRNIEQTSKADVAYDTAVDNAVSAGFGYFRITTDYADDESFELDLRIERIPNPLAVYGDPLSTASDSSDWNKCFVTEVIGKDAFEKKYKNAEPVNWEDDGYSKLSAPWFSENTILIAEWWRREQVKRPICAMSDGTVIDEELYEQRKDEFDAQGITCLGTRMAMSHKVTQTILTGAEVLERNDWAGKYIPIVPVYGDEVNVEGKRYFRSLIRDAKDAQRMLNYWRTASTELTALAPRVPFIGKKGTFKSDARKWATVNSSNYGFIEFDGDTAPARQPLDSGRAIGAIQEALNAQDDMKSILGLYDPSLGLADSQQSGKAIIAQQTQSHTSNFHFLDNLSRAIEHGGRILVDLIPTVYSGQRIIRILGSDTKAKTVQLGGPIPAMGPDGQPQMDPATNLPMTKICDLDRGRYDLTVETGPGYATRREQTADQLTQLVQAYPEAAPILGDLIVKNLDIPDADEAVRRLHAMLPPQVLAAENGGQGAPQDPMQHPAVQQIMQQGQQVIQQQGQALQQAGQELQTVQQQLVQAEQALAQAKAANALKDKELNIKAFEATTARIQATAKPTEPANFGPTQ